MTETECARKKGDGLRFPSPATVNVVDLARPGVEFNSSIPEPPFVGIVAGDGACIPVPFCCQRGSSDTLLHEVRAHRVGPLLRQRKVGVRVSGVVRVTANLNYHPRRT